MDPTVEKLYEQVNENYRFLAKWRQLAFAGHLAVVAGALSFINSVTDHAYPLWFIGFVFLLLSGICFIFRIADKRTHRLTMHACRAGVDLEGGEPGFFTINAKLDEMEGVSHSGKLSRPMESHSAAAVLLFYGSGLIFFLAGALCLFGAHSGIPTWMGGTTARDWEYTVVQGRVQGTSASLSSLDRDLNSAASNGWEFVAVGNDSGNGSFVILRRLKR